MGDKKLHVFCTQDINNHQVIDYKESLCTLLLSVSDKKVETHIFTSFYHF
jgi:hypothetical protein